MTPTMERAIASPCVLSLSGRHAARYPEGMSKKHDDPLYTVPRYTTAQVAEMLGLERVTIQSAIHRGRLASELMSPRVRLISQVAIDAYRANHLGQVGQPTRKRQQMLNKMAEAQARKAAAATTPIPPSDASAMALSAPDADDEKEA